MLFFSVGLPSRFAEWCDAVVAQLVQSLGPTEFIGANTVGELAQSVIASQSPYLVVSSRLIGGLQKPLRQADRPFILALDDPRRALRSLVLDQGLDFLEATRLVGRSCASMASCASMPGALVLHGDSDAAGAVATVLSIARHFDLPTTEGEAADIAASLAEQGISPRDDGGEAWWQALQEGQRSIVTGALSPYDSRFRGGELGPITWERDLFFVSERAGARNAASRPVDVTGGPRLLIYGPYITLPPGSWSATVALGFSKEATETGYLVDFFAGALLGEVKVQPGTDRSVEIDLNFSIAEPQDEPIVVRISNERAVFDGRLALGYVTVSPHAQRLRPETRTYFDAALSEQAGPHSPL